MISRVSAGILLICAVLLHVLTPVCATPAAPGAPRADSAVVAAESRNPHTTVVVISAHGAAHHHDESYDPLTHLSRVSQLGAHAPAAPGNGANSAPDETASPPGAPCASTARHTRNPGAAAKPSLSNLQAFRC